MLPQMIDSFRVTSLSIRAFCCVTMFFWLTISTAFHGLTRHLLRFLLTVSGLLTGVAAIITMVSVSTGARVSIQEHVATEGVNVIYVAAKPRLLQGVRGIRKVVNRLTIADATEFKASVPAIRAVCWWRREPSQIVHLNRNVSTGVYGVSPGCLSVKNWLPHEGDAITAEHEKWDAQVALLGQTVVDQLFDPDEDPVGSHIRINHVGFRVIGVLRPKGHAPGGYDQDDLILIPFTTAQRRVYGANAFNEAELIAVSTYRKEDLPETAEQMRFILRFRHRLNDDQPDDFVIRTQLEIEKFFEGAGETLSALLLWLAAGSLLAGSAGVVNVVLVSVIERTREIGVRKAVGAKRWHIFVQFLSEAMILGVLGAILGIALGVLASNLISYFAGWPIFVPVLEIMNLILALVLLAAFCGVYPAWRAATLNPIEALRYE